MRIFLLARLSPLGDHFRHPAKAHYSALNNENPYRSPTGSQSDIEHAHPKETVFVRGTRRGPALYIMVGGLLLSAFAPTLLMQNNPIAFGLPFAGCSIGGLIFRFRSKSWPEDSGVLKRVLLLSAILLLVCPGVLLGILGTQHQGFAITIIVFVVGLSVVAGFALSGVRRHGTTTTMGSQDGAG